MSEEEINAMVTTTAQNTTTSVEDLCEQLKAKAAQEQPNVTSVRRLDAEMYFKTLPENCSSTHHLKAVAIGSVLSWVREDPRVTKEVFSMRIHSSQKENALVIKRTTPGQKPQRVSIKASEIMGMKLAANNTIHFDLLHVPKLEIKEEGSKSKWSELQLSIDRSSVRCSISFCSEVPKCELQRLPGISSALERGLQQQYPSFKPSRDDLKEEDFLPIIRDPLLVRAMQLCILDLQGDTDRISLVTSFSKLYKAFKELLQERINESDSAGDVHEE